MPNSPVGITGTSNKQLYNGGSEWQNDYSNLPDYYQTFNRNYDVAIARFVGVDPVAESAESMTSYQYAGNNPVMLNDPFGDQTVSNPTAHQWVAQPVNNSTVAPYMPGLQDRLAQQLSQNEANFEQESQDSGYRNFLDDMEGANGKDAQKIAADAHLFCSTLHLIQP